MATRARRNKFNGDKDATDLSITYNVLRSLVTDVTQVMATAISNVMVPVRVRPKTITYSSSVDLYDEDSFEMKTKEGKYRWHLTTKTSEGWKKDFISATVNHANKILDLFNDCSVQFGLGNIINIPRSRIGTFHATP